MQLRLCRNPVGGFFPLPTITLPTLRLPLLAPQVLLNF
jgi:hypothetical protein